MQRAGRVRQRRRACCGDAVQARKEGTSGRSGAVRWWAQVERCQTSGVDVKGETARSCSPGPLQWKPTRTRARTREGLELGQIGSLAAETRPSALTTKRNLPGLRHKRDGGSMAIWHTQPSAVTAAWRSLCAAHGLSLSSGPPSHPPSNGPHWPQPWRQRVGPRCLEFPLTGLRSADAPPIFDPSSRDFGGC
jgi:hypothetical protein